MHGIDGMVFPKKIIIIYIIAVLAVISLVSFLDHPRTTTNSVDYNLPVAFGQWHGRDVADNIQNLMDWLGTDKMIFRSYKNGVTGQVVTLYVAYYPDMVASDAAHAPEVCYPGQGWTINANERARFALGGEDVTVKRLYIKKGDIKEVVFSWWQSEDRVIAENSAFRLHLIGNSLLNKNTASLWVRASVEYTGDGSSATRAEEMLGVFCSDVFPLLRGYFQSGVHS